ncbi:hypothetical protein [Brevundimonas sp.]|uniref:hypothetical protein n=1 Tax=Brevundimonas sp. TaxID=1871086 RepID=UPI002AB96452|nr:hypothetical protein [Brevundimonas sp.]MDZ4364206.1 hypothetical protein [Brevundimonas sp.]
MMEVRIVIAASALLFSSCAANSGPIEDATILPVENAALSYRQSPRALTAETGWQPSWGEIRSLEARLPEALSSRPEAVEMTFGDPPQGWYRQYSGSVRDGRRYIYGSYFPKIHDFGDEWRTRRIIVDDGGPDVFFVIYDVEKALIVHIVFNGHS